MSIARPYVLIVVVITLVGAIYFINKQGVKRVGSDQAVPVVPRVAFDDNEEIPSTKNKEDQTFSEEEIIIPEKSPNDTAVPLKKKSSIYTLAKEITTPDGFVNTEGNPITISSLIGKKVILVDFWTYSCINCQRTTPYLNAWYEKYKDKGLVIIGVHTPEFEFEKKYENVVAAVKKFNIAFPVILDNDYSTWTAYKNQYWPRKYLIDIDGYIVYDHIGEGGYEETEKKIQELLEERKTVLGMSDEINKDVSRPNDTVIVDPTMPRSPEIYFGATRNNTLGNGTPGVLGLQHLVYPKNILTHVLYMSGDWDFHDEFAENKGSQEKIIFRYQAKNVYMVAGSDMDVPVTIMRDGKLVGKRVINQHTLYTLVQDTDYSEHTLEIIIENPGLRVFTFTFG